jgi:DNA-binding response OmpR family regulator
MLNGNVKYKTLIVDDDIDILKVLKANLEFHNFDVITASSWEEGQKAIFNTKPDIIILDVMLPDGDGVEICKNLRKEYPQIPIIMLTAKDKISDKVLGLESGADDYIVKPFETLELIARMKACMRRMKTCLEDKIKIKDLFVDFKKRIVMIKDKEIFLTPKEYELLCYLIKNRGSVVSRNDIRNNLYKDTKIYSWSRVIDVHVQHLRQKLEDDPSNPSYIITIPGVGYKFKNDSIEKN